MSATKTAIRYADDLRAIGAGRCELSFNAQRLPRGISSIGRPVPTPPEHPDPGRYRHA